MYLSSLVAGLLTTTTIVSAIPVLFERSSPASALDFAELHREAELSSAAYTGCTGSAFNVTITLQVNDLATDTQGFVGYDITKERITVAMRGSTSPEDFLNDLDITPVTPVLSGVSFPPNTTVMNGVYSPWASVHSSVITEVTRLIALYPSYTLESTGHSLGGSLTYLSYIALTQNFPGKNVTSNALNAFAIGNDVFAAFGTEQDGFLRRGTNFDDGVPNMYPQFTHYGTEYYGDGTLATTVVCDGEKDPTCSAGDGFSTVTVGHLSSFGILMDTAGCGT